MEAVTPAVCELAVASSPTDWRYVVRPSLCVFFVRHAMSSTCMYHMSTHANERACLAVHTHLS